MCRRLTQQDQDGFIPSPDCHHPVPPFTPSNTHTHTLTHTHTPPYVCPVYPFFQTSHTLPSVIFPFYYLSYCMIHAPFSLLLFSYTLSGIILANQFSSFLYNLSAGILLPLCVITSNHTVKIGRNKTEKNFRLKQRSRNCLPVH